MLLCVGTVSAATPTGEPRPLQITSAFYQGEKVNLTLDGVMSAKTTARLGPWVLGAKLKDGHPHDSRKNLYVVFPGTQYHNDAWPEYDLNCVVNYLPTTDESIEWDVYFALALDPSIQDDLRDERDLLLANQASFRPADLMEFEDIPSGDFLRSALKIDGMSGLSRLRRRNGLLPKVAIIPAGFAIRAAVRGSDTPERAPELKAMPREPKTVPASANRVPTADYVVPSSQPVSSSSNSQPKAQCHSGPDYRICNFERPASR